MINVLTPAGVRNLVVIFPVETAPSEERGAGQLSLGLRVDGAAVAKGADIADGSLDPRGFMPPSKGVIAVYGVSHSCLLLAAGVCPSLLSFLPIFDFLTESSLNVASSAGLSSDPPSP